jgi:hypothetical protein
MPRRKNPATTLFLFLLLCGAGWGAYHFLYVKKVLSSNYVEDPPAGKEEQVRTAVEQAMRDDPCFLGITSMGWRSQEFRWRVDVDIVDACRDRAKSIAEKVNGVVRLASGGMESNVFCYVMGQEVARYVP